MASPQITYYVLFLILFTNRAKAYTIQIKMPEIEENNMQIKDHLKNPNVTLVCNNRERYCRSNNTINVCALRIMDDKKTYKNYINSCYLFLSNMCDNPGEEFHIISSGYCEDFLATRRNENINTETTESPDNSNVTEKENSNNNTTPHTTDVTTKAALRQKTKEPTTRYPVDEAYDWHPCPVSCPNIYLPQCLNVNRGGGKYFKFFTFVNHCEGDLYYCKHPEEFAPVPGEDDEDIQNSLLSWSHCASAKYLQFSRFVEVASSMGHFGWLHGNYKVTHILEPHERMPGYG